jgi:hypothetical protein
MSQPDNLVLRNIIFPERLNDVVIGVPTARIGLDERHIFYTTLALTELSETA